MYQWAKKKEFHGNFFGWAFIVWSSLCEGDIEQPSSVIVDRYLTSGYLHSTEFIHWKYSNFDKAPALNLSFKRDPSLSVQVAIFSFVNRMKSKSSRKPLLSKS